MRVRKKHLERAGLFNHFIQAGLFSSIFTFTSNIGGLRIIFERGLHAILFPIAIAPDAIASLLAIFSFGKAKNKNLGRTFDLIYVPTKAALVFTAVFAGLSVTIVNSLFLTVISSGIVYHTGLGLYNAYQWRKTPASHLKLKTLYKNNIINNAISSLIGAIVLTGVITTLIFNPFLSAPILAIAGIGTAVMLMSTALYTVYRHFKQPTILPSPSPIDSTTPLLVNTAEPAMPELTGYYYRKFRSEKLKLRDDDFEEDKAYLLAEIENKKAELASQIDRSQNTSREFFWPEEPKRQAKQAFLQNILEKLLAFSPKLDNSEFISDIDLILSGVQAGAFQSFFRAKSDVGDIVDAIKAFVNHYKESLSLPPTDLHPNNTHSAHTCD